MSEQENPSGSLMWKAIVAAVVLVVVAVPLGMLGKGGSQPAGSGDEAEARIQPVAKLELQLAAAGGSGPKDAASIYNSVCAACHGTGALNAPKKGDAGAWGPRKAAVGGVDGLVKSAIAGKNAMPPKGGAADLTDAEIKSVIEFMLK